MRFKLWLMGQNTDVQRKYRKILEILVWNGNRKNMPEYFILEVVLEGQIIVVLAEIAGAGRNGFPAPAQTYF